MLSLIFGDRGELTHFQFHAQIWVSWALRLMAKLDSQHLGREGLAMPYRPPTTTPSRGIPGDAVLTIWVVVNLVNVLQAVGFVTRVSNWDVQRIVGIVIAGLAVPATLALVSFARRGAGWRFYSGPLTFDAFVVLLVVVEYVLAIEWRSSGRPEVLVPLVSLFFGSIFLMGAPMLWINRRLWAVTAVTATVLLSAMLFAMSKGVG